MPNTPKKEYAPGQSPTRRHFLKQIGSSLPALAWLGCTNTNFFHKNRQSTNRPNILLITLDDMHWQTPGCFGGKMPDITPNIDRFAAEGMRFNRAHVTLAVCTPCRSALLTGCYPQRSGVEGFQRIKPEVPTLSAVLGASGYDCSIIGKPLGQQEIFHWAHDLPFSISEKGQRNPQMFYNFLTDCFRRSRENHQPFFVMANCHDPHRPYHGSADDIKLRSNNQIHWTAPSRIYTPDEVEIPGFLPDLPDIRTELAQYYSSARRADDTVAAILRALKDSGLADDTIVMLLSDNGMSFPFAKTNCYYHSTRTCWIVRWPGVVQPQAIENDHFISAIDFMPTVLEAAGISAESPLDGASFMPLLHGRTQPGREMVFTQFNHIHGRFPYPMRCVQNERFGYIFNPWSNGTRKYAAEPLWGLTYNAMKTAAPHDSQIARRVHHLEYRTVEEFYDFARDPDALHNLIDDPRFTAEIQTLRNALENWMIKHNDPALAALQNRTSPQALENFMAEYTAQASREIAELKAYEDRTGYYF